MLAFQCGLVAYSWGTSLNWCSLSFAGKHSLIIRSASLYSTACVHSATIHILLLDLSINVASLKAYKVCGWENLDWQSADKSFKRDINLVIPYHGRFTLGVTSVVACLSPWPCLCSCKASSAPDNGIPIHMWGREQICCSWMWRPILSSSNPQCGCLSSQTRGRSSEPSLHILPAIGQMNRGKLFKWQ